MDFTINPDFGQVEADPSVVNLTAFETYYSEKRPFFIEGRNILNFQIMGGDGDFSFREGMRDLLSVHPHNVFLVKFSYCFQL